MGVTFWSNNKKAPAGMLGENPTLTNMGNFSPRFSNKMFGHAGVGGTVAFGDLDKGLGYAFLCNKQHELRELYKTSNELVDALYTVV